MEREILRKVACPTLILHDPFNPIAAFRHAQYAAMMIAGAELLSLHAPGHRFGQVATYSAWGYAELHF